MQAVSYENFIVEIVENDNQLEIKGKEAEFGFCILGANETSDESPCNVYFKQTERLEDGSHLRIEYTSIKDRTNLSISNKGACVPLCHSHRCPAMLIRREEFSEKLKSLDKKQKLRVAVCCVIEHDGHILITRRAKNQRTFPLKWVLPGGHVDAGETLEHAAKREVMEEVGLDVDIIEPFAIWESCYPTYLELGTLIRQHIVIYYRAVISENVLSSSSFPFFSNLTIQQDELDAACWLNEKEISTILNFNVVVDNENHVISKNLKTSDEHEEEKKEEKEKDVHALTHVDCLFVNEKKELVVEKKNLNDFKYDLHSSSTDISHPIEATGLATTFIMKQYLLFRNYKS